MNIKEIHYFRPDGKDYEPVGVCYYKAGMLRAIKENTNSFISTNLTESFLEEDLVSSEGQYGFEKYRGGMIVFALTENAIINSTETSKIKAFCKKLFYSTLNLKDFKDFEELTIGAMSAGNNFKGKYVSGDQVYCDKSTTIEFGGMPSEMLLLFAVELCKAFKQETVLVKDFNTNRIFLVDDKDIPGKTTSEKIQNAAISIAKSLEFNDKAS